MKKIFALFAALVLAFSLTACELLATLPTYVPPTTQDTPTDPTNEPTTPPTSEPTTPPTEPADPTNPTDPTVPPTEPADPTPATTHTMSDARNILLALGINVNIAFDTENDTFTITVIWTPVDETAFTDNYNFEVYQNGAKMVLNNTTITDTGLDFIFTMTDDAGDITVAVIASDGTTITVFPFILGAVG